MKSRRRFLWESSGALAAAQGVAAAPNAVTIDPTPQFEISPHLYMQFMEPLGTTDSSVEAAWDYDADDWRKDLVETTKDLAPGMIRWGGLYSRYYKWREGVGPVSKRPWQRNYVWGGKETNRTGTHEFVDFCRRVGAEPLYCVNFLSDGEQRYRTTREGDRTGDAREAADWVSYANDPSSRERRAHGVTEPYNIKFWQIGNETSYGNRSFGKDESIARTIEFAKAMKGRDRSIRLIGWGDRNRPLPDPLWAADLVKRAGEHIDYVAIHMMGQNPRRPDTVLKGQRYQQDPARAWEELKELANNVETRVAELVDVLDGLRATHGIAITEGHLSLSPHNANPILTEWLSAVYHARSLNIYQRHGARVKIATAADFEGNRWTVNAVLLETPGRMSYLTPAGSVMRLFGRHNGTHAVTVRSGPSELDVAASRKSGKIFLHVANLSFSSPVETSFAVEGFRILGGSVYEIAPEDPRQAVGPDQPDVFAPRVRALEPGSVNWRFPARSVSAVELDLG
jgi:alpha-N-arabinofuranosidase